MHTPNIDALAAAGARFTAASSTYPVCVPYRFTLMTGEYAHTRFISSIEWRMSPAERTLADEFNEAGYHTSLFGKWHLYGGFGHLPGHTVVKASRTPVARPFQGRFARFAGFDICNDPYDTYYVNEADPALHKIDGFQTDGLFDLTIDYLREPGRSQAPFFSVLSVEPPHPMFTAPPEYLDRWRDREIIVRDNVDLDKDYEVRRPHASGPGTGRELLDDLRVYYAMIENLDDNIGRLVQMLREQGHLANTIIALSADHGELLGCHGLLAKQRPWEESIGVPLIFSGPGTDAGVITDPTCTEDLFPTLLGLAGIRPRDAKPALDLAPQIRGEVTAIDRDGCCSSSSLSCDPTSCSTTRRGIRTDRYKYTVLGDAHGGRPWQFFDLQTDPYELENLVDDADHADEIRRHHQLLRDRMVQTYDHYVLAPAHGVAGLNEWDDRAEHQLRSG